MHTMLATTGSGDRGLQTQSTLATAAFIACPLSHSLLCISFNEVHRVRILPHSHYRVLELLTDSLFTALYSGNIPCCHLQYTIERQIREVCYFSFFNKIYFFLINKKK